MYRFRDIYVYVVYVTSVSTDSMIMVVWRFTPTTAKSIYLIHVYTRDETVPNHQIKNPPIFLLALILDNLPNLVPAKFSGYTVNLKGIVRIHDVDIDANQEKRFLRWE